MGPLPGCAGTCGKAGQLTHIIYQEAEELVDSLHLCDISSYPQ